MTSSVQPKSQRRPEAGCDGSHLPLFCDFKHPSPPLCKAVAISDPGEVQVDQHIPVGQENRPVRVFMRSEEHTSELQSRGHLVCRLLLEKKNTTGVSSAQ